MFPVILYGSGVRLLEFISLLVIMFTYHEGYIHHYICYTSYLIQKRCGEQLNYFQFLIIFSFKFFFLSIITRREAWNLLLQTLYERTREILGGILLSISYLRKMDPRKFININFVKLQNKKQMMEWLREFKPSQKLDQYWANGFTEHGNLLNDMTLMYLLYVKRAFAQYLSCQKLKTSVLQNLDELCK